MQETIREIRAYLHSMWRWRWLGMAVFWLVALCGTAYIVMLPDQYKSEALVEVNTESMLTSVVKGLAAGDDVRRQVKLAQEKLLTRPNLEKIARSVDMHLPVETEADKQSMIDSLAGRISISSQRTGLTRISFTDHNPGRAQQVVNSVTALFIDNIGERNEGFDEMKSFIGKKIHEYENRLRDSEERLAKFRTENMAILSGSNSYAQKVTGAKKAVRDLEFQLDEAILIRDQILNERNSIQEFLTLETAPQVIVGDHVVSTTLGRIQSLQRELDTLLLRYTEDHPDVKNTRKLIEQLAARYEAERDGDALGSDPNVSKSKIPNPVYEALSAKLLETNNEVGRLKRRVTRGKEELKSLLELASIAPGIEAEMASLNRDYGVLKAQYEHFLSERERANVVEDVEAETDTVDFKLIEAAQIPAEPFGPPRLMFLGLLAVLSVGAGGGAAFLRSQMEDTFHSASKLSDVFGLPVIGTVSQISGKVAKAKAAMDTATFLAASVVPLAVIGIVALILPKLSSLRDIVEGVLNGGLV